MGRREEYQKSESAARMAILVGSKGRGTNMATLITACLSGSIAAVPAVVISPRSGTPAVHRAEALGVPVSIVPPGESYTERLLNALRAAKATFLCLAGYMYLLPKEVVEEYKDRILNIHPALLPKFGGKGMYGAHVHEAVLEAKESISGCSVHLVNENYDEGRVLLQLECPVFESDTVDSLAERVLDLEHIAYPMAVIKWLGEQGQT